ncbi:unnamed protein product [Cylicocyclus nassatus]|uniref:Uncharacterized protein n=1 Tax=Cylicocyclus nassatus TaxID=53992 RepID=A0AA36HFI5_CYLNA|nr:unnamed protein product [Cylicocyclus nassatus]
MFALIFLSILPEFLLACAPLTPAPAPTQVSVKVEIEQVPIKFVYGDSSKVDGIASSEAEVMYFIEAHCRRAIIETIQQEIYAKMPLMADHILKLNPVVVGVSYGPLQCNAKTNFGDDCPSNTTAYCCAVTNGIVDAIGYPNDKTMRPILPLFKHAEITMTTNDIIVGFFTSERRRLLMVAEQKLRAYDNAFAHVQLI